RVKGSSIQIKSGGLYIFSKTFPLHDLRASKHFVEWCREFKFGYVCTQKFAEKSKIVLTREFKLPTKVSLPIYEVGDALHFVTDGNGLPYLYGGWYGAETWGTWTMGKDAEIILKISPLLEKNYMLHVYARGFVHHKRKDKIINVYVNGKKIGIWKY